MNWWLVYEHRMFFWCNHKIRITVLDRIFGVLTHMGGATFTIASSLCIALLGKELWSKAAWLALIALAASHIPVHLVKKKIHRLRPYQVLPDAYTGKDPLIDHSFPSGHTTAIFSVIVPFVLLIPWLAVPLILLACAVALSRIYLGLHYPSDCLAGALIGTLTSWVTVLLLKTILIATS